jgi:hypothetical protein
MDIAMELMGKYHEVINGCICPCVPSGYVYTKYNETEQYKKALEKYNKDVENAQNTMPEDEFEKWEEENDSPSMPQETRSIPYDENWDAVNDLIKKSIELKKDLLWERYKDNIIDYDNDVVF